MRPTTTLVAIAFSTCVETVSSDTCSPLVGMSGPMSLTTAAAMVGVNPTLALALVAVSWSATGVLQGRAK